VSSITQGLIITAIGMGLVFVAIAALWGLMIVLVKATAAPQHDGIPPEVVEETRVPLEETPVAATPDKKVLHLAAAAAVAVAFQLKDRSHQRQQPEFGPSGPRAVNRRTAFISQSTQLIKRK
jgi:Na+-transporting methylmalonyl-CoA/oxaloacetate decarboxylase gamma subunit